MTKSKWFAALTAISIVLVPLGSASQESKREPAVLSVAETLPGTEKLAVQWVKVTAPGSGIMFAAVARPSGAGPFPVVIVLHGTHGFAQEYVQLAQELAGAGLLAVAPCWFNGGRGAGAQAVTPPIPCPDAPPLSAAASPEAQRAVDALVQAARTLPGARADRVGLFGHSRGGGAALNYILKGNPIGAAVLNSAGYPDELASQVAGVKANVLILHGTADGLTSAGGSEFTTAQKARAFEAALRAAGKPVDAWYYEGSEHLGFFTTPAQHEDEVRRMVKFFLHSLRD